MALVDADSWANAGGARERAVAITIAKERDREDGNTTRVTRRPLVRVKAVIYGRLPPKRAIAVRQSDHLLDTFYGTGLAVFRASRNTKWWASYGVQRRAGREFPHRASARY